MRAKSSVQPQYVRNCEFEQGLAEAQQLGASLKQTAHQLSSLNLQEVIGLIGASATNMDSELSARALHVIAAGRCGESWGCGAPA